MIELAKETTSQLPATFESSYLLNLYQAVEREVTAKHAGHPTGCRAS